jgi:quercetin dioxygenase-like cupin family protein
MLTPFSGAEALQTTTRILFKGMASSAPEPAGVEAARDLTAQEPRALDAELEGYAWLPRMLDKARATLAGTAGRYQFGCPVDHTCLARLGIAPGLVLELAERHADDHAVLAALRAHGIPSAQAAWFDGQAVEDELQQTDTYLRVRAREALPEAHGGRVFSGAEHGAGVSVVLIDAAPGEAQEPHAHPVEEVVAIHAGSATFFLGERQARIVRAGEVVRVPAGVAHRWVAGADDGMGAVAAYGSAEVVTEAA